MSPHVKHISAVLPQIGEYIESTAMHGDERAHFLCLVWQDGMLQCVTNTPREDLIAVLRHHLRTLETDTLKPGAAGRGH